MIRSIFTRTAKAEYLNAAYHEFFLSRNRGFGLEKHFPWLGKPDHTTFYQYLYDEGKLIAGLVLRDDAFVVPVKHGQIASIGLVWVDVSYRGQGLSTHLLSEVLAHAKSLGYLAVSLWTRKYQVYEKLGFLLQDNSLFGKASKNKPIDPSGIEKLFSVQDLISECENGVTIPPFAKQMIKVSNSWASTIILNDGNGPIVATIDGSVQKAAELICSAMPEQFRLNSSSLSTLPNVLRQLGLKLDLVPSALHMWKVLETGLDLRDIANKYEYSVLARI